MPYFVNKHGELWEYDDPAEAAADGLSPATSEEVRAHNQKAKAQEAGGSDGSFYDEWIKPVGIGLGGALQAARDLVGAEDFEKSWGMYDPSMREDERTTLQASRDASPIMTGIGEALPAAALGGAAGGVAASAAAGLGPTASAAAGILADAAVSGIGDEYTDAWLQEREVDMGNIGSNVLMNAAAGGVLAAIGKGATSTARKAWSTVRGESADLAKQPNVVARALGKTPTGLEDAAPLGQMTWAESQSRARKAIQSLTPGDKRALAANADDIYNLASYTAADSLGDALQRLQDPLTFQAGKGRTVKLTALDKRLQESIEGLERVGVIREGLVSQEGLLRAMRAAPGKRGRKAVESFMASVDSIAAAQAKHGLTSEGYDQVVRPALDAFSRDMAVSSLVQAGEAAAGKMARTLKERVGQGAGLAAGIKVGGGPGAAIGSVVGRLLARGSPQFTKGGKAWDLLSEGLERYARHPAMAMPEHAAQLSEPVKRQLADFGADITSAGRKLSGEGQSRLAAVGRAAGPRASHFTTDGVRQNDAMAAAGQEPPALSLTDARSLSMQRALKALDDHSQRQMANRARVLLLEAASRGKSASDGMLKNLDSIIQQTRQLIDTVQQDPQGFLDSVDDSLGDVEQTHPALKAAMQARTVNVMGYIHSQLPPPVGQTMDNPEGFPPSYQKSFDFALKVAGAADPEGTLNDIAAGEAFPQQVAAFRENWPELYFKLGEEVVAQVRDTDVSPERARYLDQVLGLGGQLSPPMSPSLAAAMETARNLLQQQKQQAPRTTTTGASIADNFATRRGARRAMRSV